MAKGKATPASFKPGDPRASAAGKKSSRALPPDLKEARQIRAVEFESIIYKYMDKTPEEIKVILQQKDKTPTKELIVLKLVSIALEQGDLARLNFLLDRTIGKVPDKMQLDANVQTRTLHDMILEEIENADK